MLHSFLLMQRSHIFLVFILFSISMWLHSFEGVMGLTRQKRIVPPPNSCFGLTAALVIPSDNKVRDIFVALALEAGYNMPGGIADLQPPPDTPINPDDNTNPSRNFDSKKMKRQVRETVKNPKIRISRKMIYNSIKRKIEAHGFNGHNCLLRAICEAADVPLGVYNGVVGDILHIILSPTSSKAEKIAKNYYDAEIIGLLGDCRSYHEMCPISFLDLISL